MTPKKPNIASLKACKGLEIRGAWEMKEDYKLPVRIVYVVESPLCVMAFHQRPAGGLAVRLEPDIGQLKILRELAKGVVFLPDTDKRSDALTAAGLISTQMWCRMPRMPKGVDDPEHLTLEQLRALT